MLKKNDQITLTIENVDGMMNGVAHVEGMAVFVQGALEGEELVVQITKCQKNYAFARIQRILKKSPARVAPPCPHYRMCGGCTALHMTYQESLQIKRQTVKDNLKRIGGIDVPVEDILSMETPFHYRNKTAMPVVNLFGQPAVGFYAPRSHRLVPITSCLISKEESDIVSNTVLFWIKKYNISCYDEYTKRGAVRHVVSRVSRSNEVMAVLVTSTYNVPYLNELVDLLREKVPALVSFCLSVNAKGDNVILGSSYKTLFGKDRLTDTLCNFTYFLSPLSFFQINPVQTEKLYQTALQFADLKAHQTAVDLYCGAGTISLLLAQKAKHVIGIEIVEDAVKDAQKNAEHNHVSNVTFHAAPSETLLPQLVNEGLKPDVIVLDPPRKGAEKEVLSAILNASPERIVYVSCDPATLSRDLKILTEKDYTVQKVQPVDMFSWTSHVETVVLMSRI